MRDLSRIPSLTVGQSVVIQRRLPEGRTEGTRATIWTSKPRHCTTCVVTMAGRHKRIFTKRVSGRWVALGQTEKSGDYLTLPKKTAHHLREP